MAVCTSIVKLEVINDEVDMMRVVIDDVTEAYMLGSYGDCVQFIGQEVIVSYRRDVYNGKISTFINTLTVPVKINTLEREDNIKLFCNTEDNNSNVCFADIKEGESMVGAIMYCVETKYESSPNAVWVTYKVRDKAGRIAKVRLFDYEVHNLDYRGMYIKGNIRRTQYGFTTTEVTTLPSDFPINPEVDICRTYIEKYFVGDTYMCSLFERTKLLDFMQNHISEELGYSLVRAAVELDILSELRNVFDDVDFKALSYAIIMRYGYMTKDSLTDYSENLRTLTFVLTNKVPSGLSKKVLMILDDTDADVPDRGIYRQIVKLADEVIRIKKVV